MLYLPFALRTVVGSLLLVLACCGAGLAAWLPSAADSLAANRVATPRCTSAGLLVVPNLSGANVERDVVKRRRMQT